MRLKVLVCTLAIALLSTFAMADQIAVGTLEFNTDILAGQDGGIGTNASFVVNRTDTGPDFSLDPLVITNGHLTLYPTVGSAYGFDVTDLNAGEYFKSASFADTFTFTSAVFTGLVKDLNWSISGELLPQAPATSLTAGQFVVLYATYDGSQDPPQNSERVPEPSGLLMLAAGLAGLAVRQRFRCERQVS